MRSLHLVLGLVLFIQYGAIKADDHTELCRFFTSGTVIRKPGSCTEYILCENQEGRTLSCPATQVFDTNGQSCIDISLQTSNTCDTLCEGVTDGKWVADPTNCHGFLYCYNDVDYQGYCPLNYHFDEDKQMCIYGEDSSCLGVSSLCKLVPDGTKMLNENDCSKYYQCKNGARTEQSCSSGYFHIEFNECVATSLVECTAHPYPKNLCGTDSSPKHGLMDDGATCRGYFVCKDLGIVKDLEPLWQQCPESTFFNILTQSCTDPKDVVCSYNRCDGRGTMKVASSENDCHDYIVCENGQEVSTVTCRGDMFFDETLQSCVYDIIDYKCCDGL